MAIDRNHLWAFIELRKAGLLGAGKSHAMLELGEQNWYGDVDPAELHGVIDMFHHAERSGPMHRELDSLLASTPRDKFELARLFYRTVVEQKIYRAIDLNGTAIAESHDLNAPVPIAEQFDLVTNIGTGEHVFDQAQVFRTMHERTRPGGLMYMSLPNQGSYDHGFYNYHPTFVHDLAAANGYLLHVLSLIDGSRQPAQLHPINEREQYVRLALSGGLSNYSGLIVLLRKGATETPFRIPKQGYYDNKLPAELAQAWMRLPR